MTHESSMHTTRPAGPATMPVPPRDPGNGYVAIMEGQLAMWNSRIDGLEVAGRQDGTHGGATSLRRAEASRAMGKDLSRRLQDLRVASPEHVGSLRAGLALAWRKFTAQVGGPGPPPLRPGESRDPAPPSLAPGVARP
jgi:hypothetical protein